MAQMLKGGLSKLGGAAQKLGGAARVRPSARPLVVDGVRGPALGSAGPHAARDACPEGPPIGPPTPTGRFPEQRARGRTACPTARGTRPEEPQPCTCDGTPLAIMTTRVC
jgi:hypothetical protein